MTDYAAAYFENYGGSGDSYVDNPDLRAFFANVASRLIQRFKPHSVLDAGCATGYLVEAFRSCGVAAWGIDASEYAIEHCRPGARGHVRQQSLTDPIIGNYELVTCIEVLEHIRPQDAHASIANLCCAADKDIVFTSTPSDFFDPTHLNVQAADYWTMLFARQRFQPDPLFAAPWLTEWAMHFRRT